MLLNLSEICEMDIFKNNELLNYLMNKKGELLVIGFALIIIVMTGYGVYLVYNASNNLYIGDKQNMQYLNYFKCEDIANNISDENIIVFKTKDDAVKLGYNGTEGCV